ncbi:hypothetical protein DVR12_22825 [Chitinophaga silvatica]|uniref:Iminophenyl-pyruvate dimer synthase domain-containing protein n=1 Tax=Chitinophaga silvatica TaxID=2282649 RepID=A0A3E1Y470_9BACT|nr:ferritin-like protein [Chitinophaga silvatica]RFS19471.1 hypothetical protein DVR12_22825 [Chitinophaga silvatica]
MLLINPSLLEGVRNSTKLEDLFFYVQKAIELEHSTIPPYLTAMLSIMPEKNKEVYQLIHSVVIDEMLHMAIDSNILNALGGHPAIDKPEFIPSYPGPLPMGINEGLIVNLEMLTKDVVKNTFMEIEEPENPIDFPIKMSAMGMRAEQFATIGQYYAAIKDKIDELANDKLPGDPSLQMTTSFYPPDQLFPIYTKEDAKRAIDIIVEQGEGTTSSPIRPGGGIAHYYRFNEVYLGKRLVEDPGSELGYAYEGTLPFNQSEVFPISKNTKLSELPNGTQDEKEIKLMAEEFAYYYSKLLHGLHRTFNGEPSFINNTLGLMYDIKLIGQKLAATPFPGRPGQTVGAPFEFTDVFRGKA